jgi:hypothetical protein
MTQCSDMKQNKNIMEAVGGDDDGSKITGNGRKYMLITKSEESRKRRRKFVFAVGH